MAINGADSFPSGAVTINGLTLINTDSGTSFTGIPQFTNLTILASVMTLTALGPLAIVDSTVTFNAAVSGYATASFTGEIAYLIFDDSAWRDICNFIATVSGTVDDFSATLSSNGTNNALTTSQTTDLTISNLNISNFSQLAVTAAHAASLTILNINNYQAGDLTITANSAASLTLSSVRITSSGALTISATSATALTVPSSISLTGSTLEIDTACSSADTDALLDALIAGGASSSTIVVGGTSGAPTITPEIDDLVVIGYADGTSAAILNNFSVSIIDWTYDGSIPLSASSGATIGIQDSPSFDDVMQYLVANVLQSVVGGYGITSIIWTGSAMRITSIDHYYVPFYYSGSGTNTQIQQIFDRVATLTAMGNTVTTN